jgi:hypothetical protein
VVGCEGGSRESGPIIDVVPCFIFILFLFYFILRFRFFFFFFFPTPTDVGAGKRRMYRYLERQVFICYLAPREMDVRQASKNAGNPPRMGCKGETPRRFLFIYFWGLGLFWREMGPCCACCRVNGAHAGGILLSTKIPNGRVDTVNKKGIGGRFIDNAACRCRRDQWGRLLEWRSRSTASLKIIGQACIARDGVSTYGSSQINKK